MRIPTEFFLEAERLGMQKKSKWQPGRAAGSSVGIRAVEVREGPSGWRKGRLLVGKREGARDACTGFTSFEDVTACKCLCQLARRR